MRRLSDEAFKVGVQTLTLFIVLHGCMTSCGYDTRCFDGCPPEEPRIVEHTTEVIKAVTVVGSPGPKGDVGSVGPVGPAGRDGVDEVLAEVGISVLCLPAVKQPVRVGGWVNVYSHPGRTLGRLHPSRSHADEQAFDDRIACVYVTGVEGVGPEEDGQ